VAAVLFVAPPEAAAKKPAEPAKKPEEDTTVWKVPVGNSPVDGPAARPLCDLGAGVCAARP
jgi:hypothetical protein